MPLSKALSLYDKNQDGALDAEELQGCPGILAVLKVYDTNTDQKVSGEEIAAQVGSWSAKGPAMMSLECRVTLNGRPLEGATIDYTPEPYLADSLKPASGVTSGTGVASISLSADEMPKALKRLKAMYAGTYKVKITHPSAKIPPQYGAESTLGREVSKETNPSTYDELKLRSK